MHTHTHTHKHTSAHTHTHTSTHTHTHTHTHTGRSAPDAGCPVATVAAIRLSSFAMFAAFDFEPDFFGGIGTKVGAGSGSPQPVAIRVVTGAPKMAPGAGRIFDF